MTNGVIFMFFYAFAWLCGYNIGHHIGGQGLMEILKELKTQRKEDEA